MGEKVQASREKRDEIVAVVMQMANLVAVQDKCPAANTQSVLNELDELKAVYETHGDLTGLVWYHLELVLAEVLLAYRSMDGKSSYIEASLTDFLKKMSE